MKCIEDEIPFDLPEGWAWCRLSLIGSTNIGLTYSPSDVCDDGVMVLRSTNIVDGKLDLTDLVRVNTPIRENQYMAESDILLCARNGSKRLVGKCALFEGISEPASFGAFMAIYRSDYNHYIYQFFNTDTFRHTFITDDTKQINQLTQDIIKRTLLPFPPVTEQNKIVAILEKITPIIDAIEREQQDIQELLLTTKSKILDLAIRGKLVPQDPADEPASVLLERLCAEKEELIKQGKVKRDKKESIIFKGEDNSYYEKIGNETVCIDDLLPFDIPETWSWVRMKEVCIINPRNNVPDDTEVSFIPMPLIQEGFANVHSSENKMWAQVKSGFTHFRENDVGVAKITPCFENRKSVVFHNLKNGIGAGTTELHILRSKEGVILPEYILAILKTSRFILGGVQTFSSAVGQQRISKDYVAEYLVPLPPYGEQQRICDGVFQVLDMLSTIEASLS